MEFNHSQDKKERDTLRNLITYFGSTIPHLTEVMLGKLIYIAELYHYSNYGDLLTGTRFFSLAYGPHAPAISSTIKEQLESNAIFLEKSRTSADPSSNPCMIIRSYGFKDKELSTQCLNTLGEVVKNWGDKSFEDILQYTTRTIPFLSTTFRDRIDLTITDRFHGLKSALSLPQRVMVHRFVEDNDEDVGQGNNHCESCQVSINEVAEIYLALRGDDPEKIPSREHLGFDAQAILDTFASVRTDGRSEEIIRKYPTDIYIAAQLTHSLLHSVVFRHYSARVALKTGIFFLKRCGYYFGRDILEESWPQGSDYKTLRGWFNSVSVNEDSVVGGINRT